MTPASTTSQPPTTRPARTADAPDIAAIHNQGIEERVATFETEPRRPDDELVQAALGAAAIGRLFTSNEPSVALFRRHGFTEVGVHRRHAQLDGDWRDVLLVERLLGAAARD